MKKVSSFNKGYSVQDLGIRSKSEPFGFKDYFSTNHLRSDLRKRALRGASVTVIAQACTYGIMTVGTIILARLLTPDDFGLVTMVVSFSLLLQGFGSNGFIEATIQREEIHHSQISTLFWINVGLNLMLTLLFIASAPIIAWFYKEGLLKPIVVAMSVTILFGGISTQHQALLIRNMEFYKTSACGMGAAIISLTVAIVLACRGWGYWALVAKWVVFPLVTAGGAWILCGWRPGLPARGTGVRPMLRFAFNTYGNFVMTYFRKTIDKILIGRFQGSQLLGYYDRAYHLSNMLPSQLVHPLTSVAVATLSRLSDDLEKYRHTYLTVLSTLAFACMPLSAALTLIGKDLIILLLGPQWNRAGEIFSVFGLSIGVSMLYYTHAWVHLSLGTPDRWLRWSIIAFIVTVLFFVIGLRFGALGVAVAYSASFYVLILPGLWYAGRPIRITLFSLVSAIWMHYLSALAAGLLCWFILYSFDVTYITFMRLNILVRISVSSFLCISLYLLLTIFLFQGKKAISELTSLLRDMMPSIAVRNFKI